MSQMTDLEQERAKFAFKRAEKRMKDKEYGQYAKKLPMMIKTNGLGAALAFVYSKKDGDGSDGNKAYQYLYDDLKTWLKEKAPADYLEIAKSDKELVKAVVDLKSPDYRMTTVEVLAFLTWLKRFSEGMAKE